MVPTTLFSPTYTRNIEARSCNHYCSGTAINVTRVCVFCRPCFLECKAHTHRLFPLWLYNIFPHLINYEFLLKKVTEHKMCVLICSTTFAWNISHSKQNWTSYDQKFIWSSCKVTRKFVRFEWNLDVLDKFSENTRIRFHEIPFCGRHVVPCGRTHVKTYDMVFLVTAVGLTPGGSSTVHIYTQYTEQHIETECTEQNTHNSKCT